MTRPAGHIDPAELAPDIAAYRRGDGEAGDRLCERVRPAVRLAVARMLGDDDGEVEDVVQDALLAGLRYLAGDREFAGDPTRLAVTIARNRCRDVLRRRARRPRVAVDSYEEWLADPARSALDDLTAAELHQHLQAALDSLGRHCRDLLRALYVDDLTPEAVRRRVGLTTVQGVYHRRKVCLEKAKKFLQKRWRIGSGGDVSPRTDRGGAPKRQES
jgi:RNA polymerase sigma factor (sigma-70 family)